MNIFERVRVSAKIGVIYRFWHLPSNGVTTKIVLCDYWPWPTFTGSNMLNLNISDIVRVDAKCGSFVDFKICHRMVSMQKLH